ncbi:MAG: hypothetical protein E7548_04225 [Ruminococcaceae bacterium]|nr:hypothetical protein [Oscillospiraceae bacterium]
MLIIFALIVKEENYKKYSKNRVYFEQIKENGISFSVYHLTYNNKRFLKKAKKLSEKTPTKPFLGSVALPNTLYESYRRLLEYNLFLSLCKNKKISEATVCDPEGKLCLKLNSAVKNLAHLKILTNNTDFYEEYCDSLLSLFGTCPVVCAKNTTGISYRFKTKNRDLVLGEGGFRADIASVFCPEAQCLCPGGVQKAAFFTLVANFCGFPPLLSAVPQRLILNDLSLDINSIF